jgi:hypothetical protein
MQRGPEAQRAFQKLHTDLFVYKGLNYMVVTDEFTGWPWLAQLDKDTRSSSVIRALRQIFSAYAAPVVLRPDGGRQLVSAEVHDFLRKWGVTLEPSSPHLPRTNGRAEAAVKFLKKLVKGCTPEGKERPDQDALALGMVEYRNTPRYGGRSPAEALLGHNIRDGIPTHKSAHDAKWKQALRHHDETAATRKEQGRSNYDQRAKPLQPLPVGTTVWVQDHKTGRWTIPGRIVEALPKHEYLVKQTSGRTLQRNRVLLRQRSLAIIGDLPAVTPPTAAPPLQPATPPRQPPPAAQPVAPPAALPVPAPPATPPPAASPQGLGIPTPPRRSMRTKMKSSRYPASEFVTSPSGGGRYGGLDFSFD